MSVSGLSSLVLFCGTVIAMDRIGEHARGGRVLRQLGDWPDGPPFGPLFGPLLGAPPCPPPCAPPLPRPRRRRRFFGPVVDGCSGEPVFKPVPERGAEGSNGLAGAGVFPNAGVGLVALAGEDEDAEGVDGDDGDSDGDGDDADDGIRGADSARFAASLNVLCCASFGARLSAVRPAPPVRRATSSRRMPRNGSGCAAGCGHASSGRSSSTGTAMSTPL